VVDGPHAHHALLTPTDDTGAIRGAADGSHGPLVRIVDGVQQLPTLRPKSTDLTITPATDDALPILHSYEACQCCGAAEKEHSLTLCGAKLLLPCQLTTPWLADLKSAGTEAPDSQRLNAARCLTAA